MIDAEITEIVESNLEGLNGLENQTREKSLSFIKSDEQRLNHYTIIGLSLDIIHSLSIRHDNRSQDELVIQLLGIRAFNNGATALKLGLSGYYQRAFDIVRDNIELSFLIDYFVSWPEHISIWDKSSSSDRKSNYSAVKIREALDKRDEFKDRRRQGTYSIYSELASHATSPGFKLLKPKETDLHTIGSFYDQDLLGILLWDLAIHQSHFAAIYTSHFEDVAPEIQSGVQGFFLFATVWRDKYNVPIGYKDAQKPD